jgi:GTP-binding protein Era
MGEEPRKSGDRPFLSGFVSISGRPNVGKSTFLNAVLGQKVSIVTSRAQTTRNRIIGVKTTKEAQIIFVDTPGIHRPKHGLGAHMVKEARQALKDVDVILYLVEPRSPSKEDEAIIRSFRDMGKPVVLAINKADTVKKPRLLPVMERYSGLFAFSGIIPVSALQGDGLDAVLEHVVGLLPPGPMLYDEDMITESPERFMVSELIREKAMRATREEVPHAIAVEITEWRKTEEGTLAISAQIYVEKEGQKSIIVGNRGETIKRIGTEARGEIEELLGAHVYLDLFVKVRKQWRRKKSVLADMGYT